LCLRLFFFFAFFFLNFVCRFFSSLFLGFFSWCCFLFLLFISFWFFLVFWFLFLPYNFGVTFCISWYVVWYLLLIFFHLWFAQVSHHFFLHAIIFGFRIFILAFNFFSGVTSDRGEFVDEWFNIVFDFNFFVLDLLGFSEIFFDFLVHAPVGMRFREFEVYVVAFGLIGEFLVVFVLWPGELVVHIHPRWPELYKRLIRFFFRFFVTWMNLNRSLLFLALFPLLHFLFPCFVDQVLS
jgi:hypothetical protein